MWSLSTHGLGHDLGVGMACIRLAEVAHGHQKINSKTRNLSTLDHCNSAADPVAI